MTMPALMNCAHMPDGWCLECVRKQYDRMKEMEAVAEDAVAQVKRTQVHMAETGEGTTILFEAGRNVIHKYLCFCRR